MIVSRPLLAAAAAAVLALAAPAFAADGAHHVYAVSALNGSSEMGTVTLTDMGDKTRVEVALVNSPSGVAQPAHIHAGTCAKLDPKPAFPLTTVMDGTSTTIVNQSMAALTAGGFAVNVHKSTTDIPTYVACGDLAAKK